MPTDKPIDTPADLGKFSSDEWDRVMELIRPFERACEEAHGENTLVDLAPFVPPSSHVLFRAALHELIKIDLEYRWRHGRPTRLEDYLQRFPGLGRAEALPADLVFEEYRVRRHFGDRPDLGEFRDRFPGQFAEVQRRADAEPSPTLSRPSTDSLHELELVTGGHFEVLGQLGKGGMGVVFKAYDRLHKRLVALKTMRGLDPVALYRFKNEFRSLADLTHPNLVTLYELFADGERAFFTMELVHGCSFLAYVRDAQAAQDQDTAQKESSAGERPPPAAVGPPTDEQVRRLRHALGQLVEGLLYLHEAGKLHRDIKPGNVLVTPEGQVKILDFGLAAEVGPGGVYQSTEHHILGTAPYMAPEQAASLPLTTAADWYAVGVILFQALTGRLPFEGGQLDMLIRKREHDAPAPREVAPGVPEDLDALAVELLRRDPAARPGGRDILARLKPGEPTPPPHQASAPFIGRGQHLDELTRAFHEVMRGRPVTLYVHGRSGAGKTALVGRFLDDLVRRGEAVVLKGRCYEQESVPYKALDSVIDALARHLGRLPTSEAQAILPRDAGALAHAFPVLKRVPAVASARRVGLDATDPQERRRRTQVALRELLGRLGDSRPLVVAIDDLQWGDADSAALLLDLTRPPDAPVMLLLGCFRQEDAPASPCLKALLRPTEPGKTPAWRELPVDALTIEEGKELARALLSPAGPAPDVRAEVIARESGGNPFFVCELAQHFQGTPANGEPEGHLSLGEVLWRRVRQLPESLRRLLEVIAVAGRPLRAEDAWRAAGGEGPERAAVAALRAGRLVRSAGPVESSLIETYHDRIRETVTAHLDDRTRKELHLRLAEVLEAAGGDDFEALAVHYRDAGMPDKAFQFAALAAIQAAEALAFTRSAQLYRLALELSAGEPEQRRQMRERLAEALGNAGRGTEAAKEYLAAVDGAPETRQRELQRRAALHLLRNGQLEHGLDVLEGVARNARMEMPTGRVRCVLELVREKALLKARGLEAKAPREPTKEVELARIDACFAVAVGLILVEPIRGAAFAARGLRLALDAGDPYRLGLALAAEAIYCAVGGTKNADERARLLDMAQAMADRVRRSDLDGVLLVSRVGIAAAEGDWPAALRLGDAADPLIREHCVGLGAELAVAQHFTLRALLFLGDLPEVNRRLPGVLLEAQDRDDLYSLTNNALGIRTFVRLAADEPDRARQELAPVLQRWSYRGYHEQHLFHLMAGCQIDLYQGRAEEAWARLEEHWSPKWWGLRSRLFWSGLLVVQQLRIFSLNLRASCALALARTDRRPERLWARARKDAGALLGEGAEWATALGLLLEGSRAAAQRRRDDAVRSFGAAAEAARKASMSLHEAAALRRLGQLRGASGAAELAQGTRMMEERGVRDPERLTGLLTPGCPGPA